jgi:peptide/nickel transport system substrate-binding protein
VSRKEDGPIKSSLRRLALVSVVILAAGVASCDDNEASTEVAQSDFAPVTAAPDDAAEGGTLEVIAAGDVDLDPGVAYFQFSYMVLYPMHRPLFSWEPTEARHPNPDLAAGEPQISKDNRRITIEIRDGVRFSPPVDREVTSADVEYAIERGLMPGVANAYIAPYFGALEGFAQAQRDAAKDEGVAPDIGGITTPDKRTIVFRLEEPVAATVVQALSLPLSSPVPEEYAKKFDAESPSAYGQNVVFTGPYMVANDASGDLVGYRPGKEIRMVRNPNWDASTDYRPAYLNEVLVRGGRRDVSTSSARIVEGDSQVNGDIVPAPATLKEVATEFPDQLQLAPSGSNRYVALNTSVPPFDDSNVRKAVVAAFDREALRLARGGELAGTLATHFIPPDIPGFEEAGGLEGPDLDFLESPSGDPELAAEYMRKAGFENGEYRGKGKILMVGENAGVDQKVAKMARDQFQQLGFEVAFRQFDENVMYTRFCNVPRVEVAVCPNVGWPKDFNDPQTILDPTFNGNNIQPSNNSNWPQLDVPAINRAMEKAKLVNGSAARAKAWGKVDRMVTEQAPAVPYAWDYQPNISSANVNAVVNRFHGLTDLSYSSVEPVD